MIMRTCIKCGRIIPQGSRCELHPTCWRSGSTRAWRTQRQRILDRDGHQCTHAEHGHRCPATTLLEIHHLTGGDVIGVPDHELVTRCRKHNPRGG
jgi:hypothetical protein